MVQRRELSQVGGLPIYEDPMDEQTIVLRDEKLRSYLDASVVLVEPDIDAVMIHNSQGNRLDQLDQPNQII